MANLMVGRELSDMFPAKTRAATRPSRCCRCATSACRAGRDDVSFEVRRRRDPRLRRPGRRRPHRAVRRAARPAAAQRRRGRDSAASTVAFRSPRDAARHGLTYLSEDRKGKGLHVRFALHENLTLDGPRPPCPAVARPACRAARRLKQAVDDFGIRTGDPRSAASRAFGRQPAEARDRQGAAARAARRGARRTDARRRRRRQARHLFPDPAPGCRRPRA